MLPVKIVAKIGNSDLIGFCRVKGIRSEWPDLYVSGLLFGEVRGRASSKINFQSVVFFGQQVNLPLLYENEKTEPIVGAGISRIFSPGPESSKT
jgi:hypothetical protein